MNLIRSLGKKKICWFEASNNYLLVEKPAFMVMERISSGDSMDEIAKWCSESYELPLPASKRFVEEILQMLKKASGPGTPKPSPIEADDLQGSHGTPIFSRVYRIIDCLFRIDYADQKLSDLVHPRFAHLEVFGQESYDHHFQFLIHDESLLLQIDGELAGQWNLNEAHLLMGRFYIELLNRMYKTRENAWMAVFHATAVSMNNKGILFLGDSGKGKSTLAAILMANGFHLCADDFVPADADNLHIWSLPAALSVKASVWSLLNPIYPQLESAKEFYFPEIDKTVRYLVPDQLVNENPTHIPCKALVFVNYQKNSGCRLSRLPKYLAFQQLIPDSWISPIPENAGKFLDWFLKMPCYHLTYSDNDKMVRTIRNLFDNVLF